MPRCCTALLLSFFLASSAQAACQRDPVSFDFPAQRMDEALQQLAHRTGCFIHTRPAAMGDTQVPAVSGTYRPEEALWAILKGSGWEGYRTDEGLAVNRHWQTWVKRHTQTLRARLEALETLNAAERQAYLDELQALENSVSALAREQGFISAGEHASYQRSIEALESTLRAHSS
ncbi:hypothetical protein [Vreelandella sp. TE19]